MTRRISDVFKTLNCYRKSFLRQNGTHWDEMAPNKTNTIVDKDLRKRAEEGLASEMPSFQKMSREEAQTLIHELQVHQIELEMQNDELRQARAELEESRERYSSLYDFAPVGYLTLDRQGRILEANLTAAGQLGVERSLLINKPLLVHVLREDRNMLYMHLREVFENGKQPACDIQLEKKPEFYGHLESIQVHDTGGRYVCRTSLTDVTERKKTERRISAMALELSLTEERERRSIAAEIHDGIGQILAAANLRLETLRQSTGSGTLSTELDTVRTLLLDAIERVRSATFELSPPILYYSGLGAAIEWLCERIGREYGLPVEFSSSGQLESIDEDASILLYRAVRELATNTAKHAHAQKMKVSVGCGIDDVCLCIEDNGIGFDVSKAGPDAVEIMGFGLFSVRERLKHLGADMQIASQAGKGTRINIVAPLISPRKK